MNWLDQEQFMVFCVFSPDDGGMKANSSSLSPSFTLHLNKLSSFVVWTKLDFEKLTVAEQPDCDVFRSLLSSSTSLFINSHFTSLQASYVDTEQFNVTSSLLFCSVTGDDGDIVREREHEWNYLHQNDQNVFMKRLFYSLVTTDK